MNHLPRDLVIMALQKDMPTDKTWDMLNGFINHPKVRKISKDIRIDTDAKVDRIYQLITPYLRKSGIKKYSTYK